MACLVAVLVVQLLPQLLPRHFSQLFSQPHSQLVPQSELPSGRLLVCLAAVGIGLIVDVTANWLRHHRPMCGVSAAVTALIICLMVPAATLWGTVLLVVFGLLVGKHLWGGTGHNPINPAILAVVAGTLLFPGTMSVPGSQWVWVAFSLISLPFLAVRPFAGMGMLVGLLLSLQARGALTGTGIAEVGLWLWVCVVITDPVTITDKPIPGIGTGLVAGLAPMLLDPVLAQTGDSFLHGRLLLAPALGVLAANAMTWAFRTLRVGKVLSWPLRFGPRQRIRPMGAPDSWIDLTDKRASDTMTLTREDPTPLTSEELLTCLERNGVFGFGGAGFPTSRKIRAVLDTKMKERVLLVNAVECDPGLLHDRWLLCNRMDEVADGISLLRSIIGFDTVTLAVHSGQTVVPPASVRLYDAIGKYPAGAERLLISAVLGRTLHPDEPPATQGVLVLNIQTVLAIHRAVRLNEKADTRFLTVADVDGSRGAIVKVSLGMRVFDMPDALRQKCPSLAQSLNPARMFAGGGMMQAWHVDETDVVDTAVNFVGSGRMPRFKESPQCSRCGRCGQVCPAHLPVADLVRLASENRAVEVAALHPERCMSCGSCSVVCLAGMDLTGHMRLLCNRAKTGSP